MNSFNKYSIKRLLYILSFISLAITQATIFINRNRYILQDYLAALDKDK